MMSAGNFVLSDPFTKKELCVIGIGGNSKNRRRIVRQWKKKYLVRYLVNQNV